MGGLAGGLSLGLGVREMSELSTGLVSGLVSGLAGGLAGSLAGGLYGGLTVKELARRSAVNEGMRRSVRSALISALGGGLVAGFAIGAVSWVAAIQRSDFLPPHIRLHIEPVDMLIAGLYVALPLGVVAGLVRGGLASLQHLALCLLLWRNDLAPWRYVALLDHATERIFLRKVGGGYIFIHRLLQDYFADLWEKEYSTAK